MSTWRSVAGTAFLALMGAASAPPRAQAATLAQGGALSPDYLDQLLAPVALYPDPLLAQILLCSGNPSKVTELSGWLKQMSSVKGSTISDETLVTDRFRMPAGLLISPARCRPSRGRRPRGRGGRGALPAG